MVRMAAGNHGWIGEERVRQYDQMLIALRDTLLGANIDFDYGEEDLLSRHARATKADGVPVLRVGKATYKAVVVPPQITMRSSTLALLKKFRALGGLVVFAGEPAEYVDALASDEVIQLAGKCPMRERGRAGTGSRVGRFMPPNLHYGWEQQRDRPGIAPAARGQGGFLSVCLQHGALARAMEAGAGRFHHVPRQGKRPSPRCAFGALQIARARRWNWIR